MTIIDQRVDEQTTARALGAFAAGRRFHTLLADPPWRFRNAGGRPSPENRRLFKYPTMATDEIAALPVADLAGTLAHLYLWVPNALLPDGLQVVAAWGFQYMTNLVWKKTRGDGETHGGGVGWYFRNATELVLFGVRGGSPRTLAPARAQVNILEAARREHSRKPDEFYDLIERCSPGPYLELFARRPRVGWSQWGNEMDDDKDFAVLLEEFGEAREQRGRLLSDLAVLNDRLAALDDHLVGLTESLQVVRVQPPTSSVVAYTATPTSSTNGGAPAGDRAPTAPAPVSAKAKKRHAKAGEPTPTVAKVLAALSDLGGTATRDALMNKTRLSAEAIRPALGGAVRGHRVERLLDGTYTLLIGG